MRKFALFTSTNVLIKINFKLNLFVQAGELVRAVDKAAEKAFEGCERSDGCCAAVPFRNFPVSDLVTYHYFVGRLRMFEDRCSDARYQ